MELPTLKKFYRFLKYIVLPPVFSTNDAGDGLGHDSNTAEHIPEREGQIARIYPQQGVIDGRGGGYPSGCVLPIRGGL